MKKSKKKVEEKKKRYNVLLIKYIITHLTSPSDLFVFHDVFMLECNKGNVDHCMAMISVSKRDI